jgi:hypothetical protein
MQWDEIFMDPAVTNVIAPSGNPGQRHLVFAQGRWWMFWADELGARYVTSVTGTSWPSQATHLFNFSFGSIDADGGADGGSQTIIDGRSLGVELVPDGGAVHFSASSTSAFLSHARGSFMGGTIAIGATTFPSSTPPTDPAYRADGTIATVSHDEIVVDSASSSLSPACALIADHPDNGPSWSASFSQPPMPMGGLDGGSGVAVQVRSALALSGDTVILWEAGHKVMGSRSSSSWQTPEIFADTEKNAADDARTFVTCVQPQGTGPDGGTEPVGHLLSWDGTTLTHTILYSEGGRAGGAMLHSFTKVRELALSCGNDVHAFVVDDAAPNQIQGASWSKVAGWGNRNPKVVDAAGVTAKRCFLTAFDRVVQGNQVGLAWTETPDCETPGTLRLVGALVTVHDS